MAQFQFVALDNSGKERRGMVDAPSRELAATQIRSYGLLPARVTPMKAGSKRSSADSQNDTTTAGGMDAPMSKPTYIGAAIGPKALSMFTRQLATLLQSGLSLLHSLETLIAQERNVAFKWLLRQQVDNIRSGNTFSEGLSKFPKEFDPLYVNMIKAGEASGTLDVTLGRLALYLIKTRQIRQKISQASIYPVVVFCISAVIMLFLMVFIVPRFEDVFEKQMSGQELPQLTQMILGLSQAMTAHWLPMIVGIGAFVLGLMVLKSSQFGMTVLSFVKLRAPLIGDLFRKIYISRFCRTFGTLLEGGVPILEALNFSRDAIGNHFVMRAIDKVRNRVKDGEPLAKPVASVGVFPPMVSSMVEVGEESGELPEMLDQIADIYDDEVDSSISSVTSVIEPFLIILLALFVMVIAIALFLPFIKIMQSIAS